VSCWNLAEKTHSGKLESMADFCQYEGMEAPARPDTQSEIDAELRRVLAERDGTFDDDRRTAIDAKDAMAEIRRALKTPQPH
jgi:hypothetical protein